MSVLAAVCVAMAAQVVLAAPALQVEPPEVLEGERVVVRLTGLAPGESVVLHLARLQGRSAPLDAAAQAKAWAALLAFLDAAIGRGGS